MWSGCAADWRSPTKTPGMLMDPCGNTGQLGDVRKGKKPDATAHALCNAPSTKHLAPPDHMLQIVSAAHFAFCVFYCDKKYGRSSSKELAGKFWDSWTGSQHPLSAKGQSVRQFWGRLSFRLTFLVFFLQPFKMQAPWLAWELSRNRPWAGFGPWSTPENDVNYKE